MRPLVSNVQSLDENQVSQLISISEGFLKLVETFKWYPDLVFVIANLVMELIFGLKLWKFSQTKEKLPTALIETSFDWNTMAKG